MPARRPTPLLARLERDEVVEPWLHEIREPDWHGTPAELSAKAYEEERSRPAEERWNGVVGGEASRDFVERVRGGMTTFLRERQMFRAEQILPVWHVEHPDRRLAIVAHAGVNGVLLSLLLGLVPVPWEWDRFVTPHASITRLESMQLADGYTFSLTRLGDVEHLGQDQRTSAHSLSQSRRLRPGAGQALDAVDERALQVGRLADDAHRRAGGGGSRRTSP